MQKHNQAEAMQSAKRDQDQRDDLIFAQMREWQALQTQFARLRNKQAQGREVIGSFSRANAAGVSKCLISKHVQKPLSWTNLFDLVFEHAKYVHLSLSMIAKG